MSKLVPKLRFKEFSREWEDKRLGDIYKFFPTNSFSRDKLNYEKGTVKNIHYGDIHTKFFTLFDIAKEKVPFINKSVDIKKIKKENYCIEGDIIFADASEDLDDIGKSIEIINLNNESLLSGLHTLHARQKEEELIKGFAGYLFKSNFITNQIKREAQGAKVLGLSVRRLENITVVFPNDEKEQQKIANCQSSLDSLIEAQNKKIEALKKQKKGLMQQLFPQEGETVPKLRFKEFSKEWKENILGNVVNYENGKAHEKDIEETGKFIVVNSKFISTDGEVKKYTDTAFCIAKKDEVLMVLSDVPKGRAIAKCFLVDTNNLYTVNQRICKLSSDKTVNILLFYILNRNSYFLSFDDGVKQTNLRKDDVLSCPILLPEDEDEQQKIATCLSSLDSLIEAQNKKVEALKKHKKGLMQQLFVNEGIT